MTRLYGYKHPVSGKRVIALALRNRDAVLLGMGGPECGDILIWNAEGYNYDHADSLSTTYGYAGTSQQVKVSRRTISLTASFGRWM